MAVVDVGPPRSPLGARPLVAADVGPGAMVGPTSHLRYLLAMGPYDRRVSWIGSGRAGSGRHCAGPSRCQYVEVLVVELSVVEPDEVAMAEGPKRPHRP